MTCCKVSGTSCKLGWHWFVVQLLFLFLHLYPCDITFWHATLEWHAVQWYKKGHYGRLPPKMRRLYYKATVEGCGFVTTPSTMQADYEHMVPGRAPYDFDLNPHLGCDPASMDA